jgi:hypothetical protein
MNFGHLARWMLLHHVMVHYNWLKFFHTK